MRAHYFPWDTLKQLLLWLLTVLLALIFVLAVSRVAAAQCVANPTGETAVGLRNDSSYYLLFFIDGIRMDGVPSGDRSIYFVVEPGEHVLRAEAVINGETRSAIRTGNIPEGYVCMWTVTDPPDKFAGRTQWAFRDSLRRKPVRDDARREGRQQR